MLNYNNLSTISQILDRAYRDQKLCHKEVYPIFDNFELSYDLTTKGRNFKGRIIQKAENS